MTKLKLQEELQTKQLIVSALMLTAQRILNVADAEDREVTTTETATLSGLLSQIEIINEQAEAINEKIARLS